ncbi:uncharacterized protein LOC120719989 isoform X1 [Simochromis diagramma]|uniref:uncharacterized protein LOC120719989 isoform X1 n=2 Tax=Simochromis diagramma TaxID=43689 RepID=UPI001A7E917B|nr:uncharacterized protein LOC120719989 isoform X1 [Simochromis diagramma]
MKFLLLLVLSITTGYEVSFGMKACHQGWFQDTCKYPEINKSHQDNDIVDSNETTTQSSEKDETEGRFYHDTKRKNHHAAIKDLKDKCKLNRRSNSTDRKDEKPEPELESCQRTLNLILYKKTCDSPGDDYMSGFMFFCRKNNFTCEDILLTNHPNPQKSKGLIILTSHGFSASISHVSRWDTGVYWCAVVSNEGRFSLKRVKINLSTPAPPYAIKKSATVGQNFTYWCKYKQDISSLKKFFCKGDEPSICKPLINNRKTHINRFSMSDTKNKITITMREITLNDSGTYWCGAERPDNQTSNVFFGRLFLTVDGPANTAPDAASKSHDVVIVVIVCVTLLLLLLLVFVIVLILIYKRISKLQNTGNEAAVQNIKEENIYEEFQEHLEYPDSETATNTVYLTVNPPNQPDSLHYSTINFQSRSNRAGGETPTVKPSSSAYKYSAVTFSKRPTNSSVNQLHRTY